MFVEDKSAVPSQLKRKIIPVCGVNVTLKVTRVAKLEVEGVGAEFERMYNVKVQV